MTQPQIQTDALERIRAQLARSDRRRRRAEALLWLPRGLLFGLVVAATVATAARFRPLLTGPELAVAGASLAGAGLLVASLALLSRRRTLADQARFADRHYGLLERTSTAVELSAGQLQTSAELREAQLSDAARAAESIDFRRLMPLKPRWLELGLALAAAAFVAIAALANNPQTASLEKRRALSAAIEKQTQALEELAEKIEQNPALDESSKEELLVPIEAALQELRANEIGQERAMAVLSEAEADLRELAAAYDDTALQQSLDQAGQSLAENGTSEALGRFLQSAELGMASSAASALADSLSQLDPASANELALDLAAAAADLQAVDSELAAQLARAAQALREGDTAAAQQALREAAGTLSERQLEHSQAQAAAQLAASAADQLSQGGQSVAQAGGSSQGGQGQAGGQGQGQGQSGQAQGQPGQGQPGQGQDSGTDAGSGQGSPSGAPGPGGGHVEEVYVPEPAELSDEDGIDVQLPAECQANPERCGALISESTAPLTEEQSLVPYNQVFGQYRSAAFEALEGEYIPLGLKGLVRDYFSSLEP